MSQMRNLFRAKNYNNVQMHHFIRTQYDYRAYVIGLVAVHID